MRRQRATPTAAMPRVSPSGDPLVSWPRCEGGPMRQSPSCSRRMAPRLRAAAGGDTPGRARTGRDLHHRGRRRELPRPSGGGAPGHDDAAGAQHERRHDPEHRGHRRLLQLHVPLPQPGLQQATRLGHRTGARGGSQTPGSKPGDRAPGGGQTAYVNTWALGPLAPGHTQTFPGA